MHQQKPLPQTLSWVLVLFISISMAIPVIDFSKLDGEDRAETLAQIHTCCEEWGFFQLVNHGISEELLERVKKVCSECYKKEREEGFNNSKVVKMLEKIMEKGSQEMVEGVDWEDVFLLTDDNDNEWPSLTPGFMETMAEYRRELKNLAHKVLEVMDENLGLPIGSIKRAFNNNGVDEEETAFFGTKVSHYPPCPHPGRVAGLRTHMDAGGVILLYQDDKVKSLQILKDEEWIDVQPIPNAIVINTGDQIEVLSNGRYKSVWHRILATRDENRRSIASFYNPSLKATIEPAPELVENAEKGSVVEEKGNVEIYPKFLFGDYMSVYAEQKFLPKEPRFQALRAV